MVTRTEQFLSVLDLTVLKADATVEDIERLCSDAKSPVPVAAVCVRGNHVGLCRKLLADTGIGISTVVNFPHGTNTLDQCISECKAYIEAGATEIDFVIPYQSFNKSGDTDSLSAFILGMVEACEGKVILKAILEVSELSNERLAEASTVAISAGIGFLKTSTGTTASGATVKATRIMCEAINASGKLCGFKGSGGIKTMAVAEEIADTVEKMFGSGFINKSTFRIGASGLRTELINNI